MSCSLVIITFHFICDERKIRSNIKRSRNIVTMGLCKIILIFMSLLNARIIKNSNVLDGTYFIFIRKRPKANLKYCQQQICISVEDRKRSYRNVRKIRKVRSEGKKSCSSFLQISVSNFETVSKLC